MAVTFGYQYYIMKPDEMQVLQGLIVPECRDCNSDSFLTGIGILGAIIMPHNLYLHSALVKSRNIDRNKKEEVKDANRYVFIEAAIALATSLLINIAVTAVFAHGLFGKTNKNVHDMCLNSTTPHNADVFPVNSDAIQVDIHKAGIFLGCALGSNAVYIWAVGVFASGQVCKGSFRLDFFLILTTDIVINNDGYIFGTVCYGRLPESSLGAVEASVGYAFNRHHSYYFNCIPIDRQAYSPK